VTVVLGIDCKIGRYRAWLAIWYWYRYCYWDGLHSEREGLIGRNMDGAVHPMEQSIGYYHLHQKSNVCILDICILNV